MIELADLIGVPFKNNGRDPKSGLDCYGLAMEVFHRFGIEIPEYWSDYDNCEKISNIIRKEKTTAYWQKTEVPTPPALVTIRFGVPAPYVNHTGVYIGDGKFIHTREKTGVVIENVHSIMWKYVIDGYYQYIGE